MCIDLSFSDRQTAAGYLQSYRLQRVQVRLYPNLELGYTEKKNIELRLDEILIVWAKK